LVEGLFFSVIGKRSSVDWSGVKKTTYFMLIFLTQMSTSVAWNWTIAKAQRSVIIHPEVIGVSAALDTGCWTAFVKARLHNYWNLQDKLNFYVGDTGCFW